MTKKLIDLETARYNIDEAIDIWLHAQGVNDTDIKEMDFSAIDEELNNLIV